MKKAGIILLLSFCFVILLSFTCAYASPLPDPKSSPVSLILQTTDYPENDHTEENTPPSFTLPASLITIEEGAFEGTAITTVDLPESVVTVEDYAFANIPTLRNIYIPETTEHIGRDAFLGSVNVTITGAPEGHVRAWARENGIPFRPVKIYYALIQTVQANGITAGRTQLQRIIPWKEKAEKEKQKPTGRFTGDLNIDRYEIITAFHIQGRSPPVGRM